MSTDRYLRPIDQFIFHNSHHHDFLVEKVIGNQPSIAIFIKPNGYQQRKDSDGTQYQHSGRHSARTILVTANNYFPLVYVVFLPYMGEGMDFSFSFPGSHPDISRNQIITSDPPKGNLRNTFEWNNIFININPTPK